MKNLKLILIIATFGALALTACSSSDSNPTAPIDNEKPSEDAQTTGKAGISVYQNIASLKQIDNFAGGQSNIVDIDIPEFETEGAAAQLSKRITLKALNTIKRHPNIYKAAQGIAADSVIFDVTELDSATGFTNRVSLLYDSETGRARFFVVTFDYPTGHTLAYDSTEIRADLNSTLLDDSDDVLLSLKNLKKYQEGQLILQEEGSFIPDAYPVGTEPDGGILSTKVLYSNASFITSTEATFESHQGTGGSFTKTSVFTDETRHVESATFNEDGTGTVSEIKRDGTTIDGTFDSPELDNQGSYSVTTTYPASHEPAKVEESGEFTINPPDSIISGTFERKVTKLDGTVEEESASIQQNRIGDVLTTTLTVQNADGSHGFLTVTKTPDVENVTGEWVNQDLTFAQFTAQVYSDESTHLEFKLYASEEAFENGDDPLNTAVFDFYPDGSGSGVVTEGADTYDVTIHPDGSVTFVKRT